MRMSPAHHYRSSDYLLQAQMHARNVRGLRHCGDFFKIRISMKLHYDIAKSTALRPSGHGPVACGLPRGERGNQDFITID